MQRIESWVANRNELVGAQLVNMLVAELYRQSTFDDRIYKRDFQVLKYVRKSIVKKNTPFVGDWDIVILYKGKVAVSECKNWLCGWYIGETQYNSKVKSHFIDWAEQTGQTYDSFLKFLICAGVKITPFLENECREDDIMLLSMDKATIENVEQVAFDIIEKLVGETPEITDEEIEMDADPEKDSILFTNNDEIVRNHMFSLLTQTKKDFITKEGSSK